MKKLKGAGKGIDPLGALLTLSGITDEAQGLSTSQRISKAAGEVAGELPFTSLFMGNFPVATFFQDLYKDISTGNWQGAGKTLLVDMLSPVGGGLQASKTYGGIKAIQSGESTGLAQDAKSIIFGSSSTNNPMNKVSTGLQKNLKADQTKLSKFQPSVIDEVTPILEQVKKAGYGTPEADALVENLTDSQYKVYKALKAVDLAQQAIDDEPKVLKVVQQASVLGFGTPEADKLLSDSFPDTPEGDAQYANYQTIKKTLFGADGTGSGENTSMGETTGTSKTAPGTWDKQSLVTHIANIAKSLGTDPITTFKDIFHGDFRITGLTNGQVIVERNSKKEADIKKSLGGDKTYTLDHVKSLELGGNNQVENMWLIPKDQAAEDDKVENYLGKKLSDGSINGKQAQEYELRYKKSADAQWIDSRTKSMFDSVGSPLTFEQIKQQLQ